MGKGRTFLGQPIAGETVSLGVGGQLHRDDGFPELPPRSRVRFTAWADYENVKHKFLPNGKVDEILILTIDAGTFEVLEVVEQPVQEELPVDPDQAAIADVPDVDEVAKARRGRGRTAKDD